MDYPAPRSPSFAGSGAVHSSFALLLEAALPGYIPNDSWVGLQQMFSAEMSCGDLFCEDPTSKFLIFSRLFGGSFASNFLGTSCSRAVFFMRACAK